VSASDPRRPAIGSRNERRDVAVTGIASGAPEALIDPDRSPVQQADVLPASTHIEELGTGYAASSRSVIPIRASAGVQPARCPPRHGRPTGFPTIALQFPAIAPEAILHSFSLVE